MYERPAETMSADSGKEWQKTQFANLIRYVPSGSYFARLRVNGNLIRKSLKTDVLSVAKLRLADLEKHEREAAETREATSKGKMTFGDCVAIFRSQTEASNLLKPTSKLYRREVFVSIAKSWPGIATRDVRRISANDCNAWAAHYSNQYSATRYNGALGVLRAIFNVAITTGTLYRNPALGIKRAKARAKQLTLPEGKEFERFVVELAAGASRNSKNCADLVQFLAFGGCRISESATVTWADCDFEKKEIVVRGDPETGTKNWSIRRVPMIPDMLVLLQRLRHEHPDELASQAVMRVRECQKAMDRAAKVVGMARIGISSSRCVRMARRSAATSANT